MLFLILHTLNDIIYAILDGNIKYRYHNNRRNNLHFQLTISIEPYYPPTLKRSLENTQRT